MSQIKQKVIQAVNMVPYGKVASYGQIALMVGMPRGARMVGQILNSLEDEVLEGKTLYWWRIVNNAGRVSIKGTKVNDASVQKDLLEKEGLQISDDLTFDIEKYRYRPDPAELSHLKLPDEHIEALVQKYLL